MSNLKQPAIFHDVHEFCQNSYFRCFLKKYCGNTLNLIQRLLSFILITKTTNSFLYEMFV